MTEKESLQIKQAVANYEALFADKTRKASDYDLANDKFNDADHDLCEIMKKTKLPHITAGNICYEYCDNTGRIIRTVTTIF